MKKKGLLAISCMIALVLFGYIISSIHWGDDFIGKFETTQLGYHKIALDQNFYSGSGDNLHNYRLLNGEGYEMPYSILSSLSPTPSEKGMECPLLQKSSSEENILIEFAIPIHSFNGNRLDFDIEGSNFLIGATFKFSNDLKKWENESVEHLLYKLPAKLSSDITSVKLQNLNFRYVRVHLNPLLGRIDTKSVKAIRLTSEPFSEEKLSFHKTTILNKSFADNSTTFYLDNGFEKAPVDMVQFRLPNKEIYKKVSLYGSNDNHSWTELGKPDEIFLLDLQEKKLRKESIPLPKSHYRYMKILLQNNALKSVSKEEEAALIQSVQIGYFKAFIVLWANSNEKIKVYRTKTPRALLPTNREKFLEPDILQKAADLTLKK